jgi:hypothetical protein
MIRPTPSRAPLWAGLRIERQARDTSKSVHRSCDQLQFSIGQSKKLIAPTHHVNMTDLPMGSCRRLKIAGSASPIEPAVNPPEKVGVMGPGRRAIGGTASSALRG